jgi:hypothetical protein
MKKWDLYEKYTVQDARFHKLTEGYRLKVVEAYERVAEAKFTQSTLLKREFAEGIDLSADKATNREKLAEAERAHDAAQEDWRQANDYGRQASAVGRISVRDLVLDWNGPYKEAVQEGELQPILDRMAEAKTIYYNAVLDYYELMAEYSPMYNVIRELGYDDDKKRPGDHRYVCKIDEGKQFPNILHEDLVYIEDRRQLPEGIKRIKNGGAK